MSTIARLVAVVLVLECRLFAADVIPHAQDKPPNEPRDAATAAKMMTVPPGFVVEVVASEPDLVNPVAMAIDERGRFWITESLEYPRRSPEPGRDRVKILEDTDGDGTAETVKVFLDGLNIPSGIQVGHGGVWIANAPDILFVPDKDRDGVPDGPAEVVVTGFGRTDTHELPNSLTWGPDGWLYGLNGVFNHSHVKYSKTNPNYDEQHPGWPLTCAMFRIHPRTREFQVFCEGTSNPWGIAFNDEGDAFISACVIDHLWHLVETGYYHRQGGPYPPHTWKIESIVKHKHQKAAYCGITWFDSDAYPAQYNKKLYMGNIHGGCINVDRIERNGSTYAGFGEPDFLTANDSWFMPVVQKTGKDGCLYVLDWYDRYHCYQDANRDPEGIDRLKGRLYRVKYTGKNEPEASATSIHSSAQLPTDLATANDDTLINWLGHPNVWVRETAQRLLQERATESLPEVLLPKILDASQSLEERRRALWTLAGTPLLSAPHLAAVWKECEEPQLKAWAFRFANTTEPQLSYQFLFDLNQQDPRTIDPRIKLQWAIAAAKGMQPTPLLATHADQRYIAVTRVLDFSGDDPLLPRIAWRSLTSMLRHSPVSGLQLFASRARGPVGEPVIGRILRLMNEIDGPTGKMLTSMTREYLSSDTPVEKLLTFIATLQELSREQALSPERQLELRALVETNRKYLAKQFDPVVLHQLDALILQWGGQVDTTRFRNIASDIQANREARLAALQLLVTARDSQLLPITRQILADSNAAESLRADVLSLLANWPDTQVATLVLSEYGALPPALQSRAIELLTQRPEWAKQVLMAIGDQQIPATVLNVNQARRLSESKDESLRELLAKHWGTVREGRSPDRERVVAEMRAMIRKTPGDPLRGEVVFKKTCAQCHKMYGEGAEVGPDITLNGRNDYTQLLSNVFDPSLVIGSGYRSYTVATEDGRVLNGLLVEDSPQRVVLKVQGGKQEVIARDNIDVFKVSEISLMPEQLERQHTPQEIADLFAYITLDKPPTDPTAKRLPGVYDVVPRSSTNPADFAAIVQEVAPGFSEVRSGLGGVELLAEHKGRKGVVRTHPVSREQPGVLIREITLPADKKGKLVVDVSHDPRGDWRLVAYVGSGGRMIDEIVSKESCGDDGWATFTASLEKFAGETVKITLRNEANDWAYEFGYWGSVRIEFED